jgi:hypothetical protein
VTPHPYGICLVCAVLVGLTWFVVAQPRGDGRTHALVAGAQATLAAFAGSWFLSTWGPGGDGGLSVRTALLCAGAAAALYSWRYGLDLQALADTAAGPLLLTEMVARLGCVLGSCAHRGSEAYALAAATALALFLGSAGLKGTLWTPFVRYLALSASGRLAALIWARPSPDGMWPTAGLDMLFLVAGLFLVARWALKVKSGTASPGTRVLPSGYRPPGR